MASSSQNNIAAACERDWAMILLGEKLSMPVDIVACVLLKVWFMASEGELYGLQGLQDNEGARHKTKPQNR